MIAGILAVPLLVQALAAVDFPRWDVSGSCRGAAMAIGGDHGKEMAEKCMEIEQRTKQGLEKTWTSFPAADRTSCRQSIQWFSPTYSELLSCLERRRATKTLPRNEVIETPERRE